MRAAAVALVLIVGAGVILWFGNTLNSWVLGGLIGGLAALLLSIPITLLLFLSITKRHEESREQKVGGAIYQEEIEPYNEIELSEEEYHLLPEASEADFYSEQPYRRRPNTQQFRVPQDLPGLPAAGQSHAAPRANQQPRPTAQLRRSGKTKNLSSTQGEHLSAAVREARREKLQEQSQQNDFEVRSHTRKPASTRAFSQSGSSRPTRKLPKPQIDRSTQEFSRPTSSYTSTEEYETDQWQSTGNIRRQSSATGKRRSVNPGRESNTEDYIIRDTPDHSSGRSSSKNTRRTMDTEENFSSTGSLRNPLVRRAPYTYEDDPERAYLARQIDQPVARRSSRRNEEDDIYYGGYYDEEES